MCQFPSETFHKTTISELQLKVERKLGIAISLYYLLFDYQRLVDEKNGRKLTFGDYEMCDGDSITYCVPQIGGGGPGFLPLRFADLSSEDNFKELKLTRGGHKWLTLSQSGALLLCPQVPRLSRFYCNAIKMVT